MKTERGSYYDSPAQKALLIRATADVTEWTRGLQGPSVTVNSLLATKELELWLAMPEFGEKEGNYLFKGVS